MFRQMEEAWNDVKNDAQFKTALVAKLIKDYQTNNWSESGWYAVTVIYGPTAVKAELDIQRYDGEFIVWPVFLGYCMTGLDPLKFPVHEVEGGDSEPKEFRVRVTHDVVEEGFITVQAINEKEAIQKARIADHSNVEWELTDAMGDNQYDIDRS